MNEQAAGFGALFLEAEESAQYWLEHAILDFTEELWRLMEEKGVSRAEMARRIGTSPAYVTKVLRADSNFTLATMIRLAAALDCRVAIHLAPKLSVTRWIDDLGSLTEPAAAHSPAAARCHPGASSAASAPSRSQLP